MQLLENTGSNMINRQAKHMIMLKLKDNFALIHHVPQGQRLTMQLLCLLSNKSEHPLRSHPIKFIG